MRRATSPSISASVLRTSEKPQTSQVGQQSTGQVTASCAWVCSAKCIQQRAMGDHLGVHPGRGPVTTWSRVVRLSLIESNGRGGYPDL